MQRYSRYTDQELVHLLRKEDVAAFTEIHNRYYGILYSHAFQRLDDREEVKDLLQDLFTHLWNHRETADFSNLPGYLYTAVRNKVLNSLKRQKIRSDYIESFAQYVQEGEIIPDVLLREKELTALVEKEINNLPAQMKLVFTMSRKLHLSHREIARELQISPSTVKKHVNNSLKILRVKLGAYFSFLFF